MPGLTGIIFKQNQKTIGGFVIDATVQEIHNTQIEVTDNPVDEGVVVSDHAENKPDTVTMDCVISDTPLGFAFVQSVKNIKTTVESYLGKDKRSLDFYNRFVQMAKKREPIDVVTTLKKYSNMLITSISVPRTADTGGGLIFTVELREVRIVSSQTGVVETQSPRVRDSAKKTKDTAQKKVEEKTTDEEAAVRSKTPALKLVEAIFL